jgi:murein endopeptidase
VRDVSLLRWLGPGLAVGLVIGGVGARVARSAAPVMVAETGIAVATAAAVAVAPPPVIDPPPPPEPARCRPEAPLADRPVDLPPPVELARLIRQEPARLGSASIGVPTRGRLWGGVQLLPSDDIETAGGYPWGTDSVVRSIERAVREVRRCFPDSPKLHVGDISRKEGGWLRPHRSHQSGLDADIGYYYTTGSAWFRHANAENLDVARTWALLRALVDGGNVESIFIDRALQRLLRRHAEGIDEDRPRLDALFSTDLTRSAVMQHASGHATHFHVRFRDPASVALGLRLSPMIRGSAASAPPRRPQPQPGAASKQRPR